MDKVSKEEYEKIVKNLVKVWANDLPDDMLRRAMRAAMDIAITPDKEINAYMGTVMTDWVSRQPRAFIYQVTEGFLEMMASLGPELGKQAMAGILGHETFHMTQNLDTSRPDPIMVHFLTGRSTEEEIKADVEGIKLAEKAGFHRAKEGVIEAFKELIRRNDAGIDVVQRLAVLEGRA